MSDSKPRDLEDAPEGASHPSESPRTLPSIDISELKRTAMSRNRRTVLLGPEDEEENTSELEHPESAALYATREPARGDPVVRGRLLGKEIGKESRAFSSVSPSSPKAQGHLSKLLEALKAQASMEEAPLYMPSAEPDPFEGMMGATLELKVDPSMLGLEGETSSGNRERDLRWLHPPKTHHPRLPNSFGLSDRAVSEACLDLYPGLARPHDEALIAVGLLTRLEAWITDLFAEVGRESARLLALNGIEEQLDGDARSIFSALSHDADIQASLSRWKEEGEPSGEGHNEAGRMTALRMAGARVLKRQGEVLAAYRGREAALGPLSGLVRLALRVRGMLEERSRLIHRYFPQQSSVFALHFLEHRGLNARRGFVWLQREWEEF